MFACSVRCYLFQSQVFLTSCLSGLLQLSLPRRTPLWRRKSRRSGGAAATETWTQPRSLRCLTSSILLGEEWRASWTMRWPSGSPRRSWSPGICWPAATTTSTTSAWDWLSYGGWACWFATASCCLSGSSCTSNIGLVWYLKSNLFHTSFWGKTEYIKTGSGMET